MQVAQGGNMKVKKGLLLLCSGWVTSLYTPYIPSISLNNPYKPPQYPLYNPYITPIPLYPYITPIYPLYPYTTPHNTRATASHAMPMGALVGSTHRR
jgi:hypothetical protein